MPANRWAKAILDLMKITGIQTALSARTLALEKDYDSEQIEAALTAQGLPALNTYNSQIRKRIREKQEQVWEQGMQLKFSLNLYRQGEKSLEKDAPLALTRAAMLPTRAHKMYAERQDTFRRRCGV